MEERDAPLSRAYREAAHPEPSPALDARILEAARQAVARPAARKHSRWSAWAVPLSTTAVLVLGLTLLFEMQRQAPDSMAPPGALDYPAPGEMGGAVPQPAEPTMPRRGGAQEVPVQQLPVPQGEAMDRAEGLGGVAEQAPAAAPERRGGEQRPGGPMAAEPQPFPAQAGASSTQPAAKAEARAMPAPMADQSTADSAAAPPAIFTVPDREQAPAAPFSQTERTRKAVAAPVPQGPEHWVEKIRKLLREGRLEEARKELEKLQQTHPGFALPEDLKGL
jgi:resuscitation-promoting factor RpfA